MKIMCLDTETNGLPTKEGVFPEALQIAYTIFEVVTDPELKLDILSQDSAYLQRLDIPRENYSEGAQSVHGIPWEDTQTAPNPAHTYYWLLVQKMKACDGILCHNVKFDLSVILDDCQRLGVPPPPIDDLYLFCTQNNDKVKTWVENRLSQQRNTPEPGKEFPFPNIRIPKKRYKLIETYYACFEKDLTGAHEAMADVKATANAFYYLLKHKVITLEEDDSWKKGIEKWYPVQQTLDL